MKPDADLKLAVINELKKIYSTLLERNPTEEELKLWLNEIFNKGHTTDDVKNVIKKSEEYSIIKKSFKNIEFLKDVFFITFDREIQVSELDYWKKKILSKNLSRSEIKQELEKSEEFKLIKQDKIKEVEFEIWKIYKNLFNREPLEKEIDLWKDEISEKNRKLIDIVKELKRSSEYKLYKYNIEIKIPIMIKQINDFEKLIDSSGNTFEKNFIESMDLQKISYYNQLPMSERFDEYMWVIKNLKNQGALLDVGCSESLFAQEISKSSALQVYGIDIREPEYAPNFEFSKESAEKTHFDNDFFDQITIISSLEHFGINAYSNKIINKNADVEAMKEMRRILKSDGLILITLPYGIDSSNSFRKYDNSRIEKIMDGFKILEKKFLVQTKVGWKEVQEESAYEKGFSEYYPNLQLPNSIVLLKGQLM